MKKTSLFALMLLLPSAHLSAQLQDDFSDGDFSSNPEWFGNVDKFTVANGELQLLDSEPAANNTAYLYLPAPTSINEATSWEIFTRLEFDPSTSNFARLYLSASNPDLAGSQDAYYLRIGGISGNDDAIELYRQDGTASTLLISGTAGAAAIGPVTARIRVARSPAGLWELLVDYTGGTNYQTEGTATDSTYPMGSFFGLYCRYTATRNEAFFFDDILAGPLFLDTQPPGLLAVEAVSATELLAHFDEPLDEASASNAANYELDNGAGQPAEALFDPATPAQVRLLLSAPLQNTQSYVLTAVGIADPNGNIAPAQSLAFTFYDIQPAAFGDLVFSEIFPDPNPAVGLPEGEFAELYNLSSKVIQLSTLALSSGGTPAALPAYLLLPGAYVTVCDDSFESAYAALGATVALGSFPALTNSGDELRLTNNEGELIAEVIYEDSWYRDGARSDGGYSLELIQLAGPYGCPGNWRASIAPAGGTPGLPNSLPPSAIDDTPPTLLRAIAESEFELRVTFSEVMDEASLANLAHYTFDPPLQVAEALLQPGRQEVLLVLDAPLQAGTAYQLSVTEAATDCMGNPLLPGAGIQFGLAEPIEPLDIIINELLFNPATGGSDFIELYNRSEKVVNLNGLAIANTQRNEQRSISVDFLLFPGEYAALTDAPDDISSRYAPPAQALLETALPALDDKSGNVTIRSAGLAISEINYDDSWYRDAARSGDGYSIELIQAEGPYDCPGNWRASIAPAGGTPGLPNSLPPGAIDDTAPTLLRAIAESEFELRITFSKVMDAASLANLGHYTLAPPLPATEALLQPGRREVLLVLDAPLQAGTTYQLSVSEAATDCMGTPLPPGAGIQFGLAEPIEPLDIVINELLFNPETNGSDFIELYNRSDKIVNLNGLNILNTQKTTTDSLKVVSVDFLLFPGEHAALTDAPGYISSRYTVRFPRALVETPLPSLDDKNGNVSLRSNGAIVDAFDYTEGMHYPLLDIKDGVSLERISPDAPTQDAGNWHSAASTAGFATPTYQNSQFFARPTLIPEMITVAKTTFSPDGDGFEDVLLIDYQTGQAGYTLNIHIYDSNGRLVRRLANNETLAARGSLKWEGITEEGNRARIGIYVLWFELFTPDGAVERDKKAVVLAGRLE